jgi:uroporphyrinogen decarboxylase
VITDYLRGQAAAGAQALQIFDSWVGALSPYDYQEQVLPYVQRIVANVRESAPGVPIVYFGTGQSGWLPLFAEAGSDVIGVDWRIDIAAAREILGPDVALQGNLDPQVLLSSVPQITRQAARILDSVNGGRGYIFNLGHGVIKSTPESHVAALVDFVHEHGRR